MTGATETKASLTDWLAVAAAILGAFTAILDIQITNSSLSDIQGALGASPEEGSWISTAYLMAEIIVIPLTGWLGSIFGLRRYLATNTALFIGFSIACALSTSLTEMIFFRAGQGFTGGVLIPTAITIVRTRLPKSQQGVGIAFFGLTATFAPAIGPTIGGWLTDNLSWHYIFYLNLLPGPLALALQVIVQAAWLAVIGIAGFIVREFIAAKPFINLRVLGNRSVGGGCLLMTVLGAVSFGSIYVIPVYCAQIQGYNAEQIGYVVMWSGLPQLLLFPAMPFFMKRFDPRILIVVGTLLFAASCFINVDLTHDVGMDQLILPQLLRAAGQPLFTVPLSQISTAGLPPRDTADASALSNMMRNLGGSIGIATLSTMIERREHFHFSVLAEAMTQNAMLTQQRLGAMAVAMQAHVIDPIAARAQALNLIAGQVRREAYVMAYSDAFWIVGVGLIVSLVAITLLRKPPRVAGPVEAH
jgi:DHA2 family multidrug resistance protein